MISKSSVSDVAGKEGAGRGPKPAAGAFHLLALMAAALMLTAHVTDGHGVSERESHERPWPGEELLFALEVWDPAGELILRPRIIGEAGRPSRFELWGESENDDGNPYARIVLDALGAVDGLDLSLVLSLNGLVDNHRLRLRMPLNEPRTVSVPTNDGRYLQVHLRAFRVGSDAFEAYIDAMERQRMAERTPQA